MRERQIVNGTRSRKKIIDIRAGKERERERERERIDRQLDEEVVDLLIGMTGFSPMQV